MLVKHFDLVRYNHENKELDLYFEEYKIIPKEESKGILIAHGFHTELTIQDFPLRGNTVIFILNPVIGWIRLPNRLFKETGI